MCLHKVHNKITAPKTGTGFKALSKDGRPPFYTEVEGYPVKAGDVEYHNILAQGAQLAQKDFIIEYVPALVVKQVKYIRRIK